MSHTLVHLGEAAQSVEHPHEAVGRVEVQIVDVALEPVGRRQLLGEEQLAGGEMQADLLTEAAARLGGDVHADIAFLQQLAQAARR